MRLLIIMLALGVTGLAGCSRSNEGGNYVDVKDDDAAMNAAIAKAKATSAGFITAFHAQKSGTKDFFVKKPYRTPKGSQEHMWIEIHEEHDGVLKGVVANDAEETREVKMGDEVTLSISEISDWKYQDGKKLIGGYTIRYFVDRMSPKEREEFLKENGFEL